MITTEEFFNRHVPLAGGSDGGDREAAFSGGDNELVLVGDDNFAWREMVVCCCNAAVRLIQFRHAGRGTNAQRQDADAVDDDPQRFVSGPPPKGVGAGPRLQGPHLVANLLGGTRPVDEPVLLLKPRRLGRQPWILRRAQGALAVPLFQKIDRFVDRLDPQASKTAL